MASVPQSPKLAKQIETPRPPDPILRRPCADREEKRVTHGKDIRLEEPLDSPNPNQRRLSAQRTTCVTLGSDLIASLLICGDATDIRHEYPGFVRDVRTDVP